MESLVLFFPSFVGKANELSLVDIYIYICIWVAAMSEHAIRL